MDGCWMNEWIDVGWMDEYILCECVLEKNKLLMIFGGNTMLVQYHFKDKCTTYY